MIEIYHFRNRFGKQCVAVFIESEEKVLNLPDFVAEYYTGIDPPDYNLPVIPVEAIIFFDVVYIVERLYHREVHDERCYVVLGAYR
jgi:hypothetical protein